MFTGIIEAIGTVQYLQKEGSNLHIRIASPISRKLKVDQSVSHNGVCLTVVHKNEKNHTVTAIKETLERSNLGHLEVGSHLNLERAMQLNDRLNGHLVQGHVDQVAFCTAVIPCEGSWEFHFEYQSTPTGILVDKGSISINGVSLTVVNPSITSEKVNFSVAIIPYTYEHTNFGQLKMGHSVNLEFDILGKYVASYLNLYTDALRKRKQ